MSNKEQKTDVETSAITLQRDCTYMATVGIKGFMVHTQYSWYRVTRNTDTFNFTK